MAQENSLLENAYPFTRLLLRYRLWRSGIRKDKEAFETLKNFVQDLQTKKVDNREIMRCVTASLYWWRETAKIAKWALLEHHRKVNRMEALKIAFPFIVAVPYLRNCTYYDESFFGIERHWWEWIRELEEQSRYYNDNVPCPGLWWTRESKLPETSEHSREKICVTKDEFIYVTTKFLLESGGVSGARCRGLEKVMKNLAHLSSDAEEYRKYLDLAKKYSTDTTLAKIHISQNFLGLCEECRNVQAVEEFYQFAKVHWGKSTGMRFDNLCGLYGLFHDVREVERVALTMQRHLPWWLNIDFFHITSGKPKSTKQDVESFVSLLVEAGGKRLLEIQQDCPTTVLWGHWTLRNEAQKKLTEKVEKILETRLWNNPAELEKARADIRAFDVELLIIALRPVWANIYGDPGYNWLEGKRKIRWAFDSFSPHVRHGEEKLDWRQDNSNTRRYWSVEKTRKDAWEKFRRDVLSSVQMTMSHIRISQIPAVAKAASPLFSIETFKARVPIPTRWKHDSIQVYESGPDIYSPGSHVTVEVLVPTEFEEHTFTFQRPVYKELLQLLEDPARLSTFLAKT